MYDVDGLNNLVNVNFDVDDRSIVCTFLNQPISEIKKCVANITYGVNCDQLLKTYSGIDTGNDVKTEPLDTVPGVAEYCFLVTATSNNITVKVEGNLVNLGNTNTPDTMSSL